MPSTTENLDQITSPRTLRTAPLSAGSFAPFGRVMPLDAPARVNEGRATRHDIATALARTEDDAVMVLSWFDLAATHGALSITKLEQHPHSEQAFLPVAGATALVLVARAGADGKPDETTLTAFASTPGQAVIYRPGVWHAGLTALSEGGKFLMAMWRGAAPDTELIALDTPVAVTVS
ncbi:ureidoglycolate lyase [Acuticoccus sp. MNP-M23]|uniref:ureidoglycolate lyase n=1 Tax=Acuticoccus sp. MNP-M23 TaxID=3072793 RepID=UPI002815A8EB|nr:ureidoglycolate lyase [Acuticoccus sp. MNP-M23]WMS41534.1 ureidoglycolate lyase [Acuticoccus sp. MNP-M23]